MISKFDEMLKKSLQESELKFFFKCVLLFLLFTIGISTVFTLAGFSTIDIAETPLKDLPVFGDSQALDNKNFSYVLVALFLNTVFFAPVLETFIFQWLPLKIADAIFGRNSGNSAYRPYACAFSGLLFGLAHMITYHNIAKGVSFIFVGFLLAFLYYRSVMRGKKGFFEPMRLHAFVNLLATIMISSILFKLTA